MWPTVRPMAVRCAFTSAWASTLATASEVRSGSDLSVDAQDAQGVLSSDRITETDILDGRWDNAAVEVWRVNWAAPSQRVLLRRGAIGQIRRGRLAFVAEVRSLAHVLGQTVGRTFQASCDAALGDTRCGVNLEAAAFKGSGAVIDVLRDRAFTASGLGSFTAGWFAFGPLSASHRRQETLEALQAQGLVRPVLQLGLRDEFIEHGDPAKLLALQGLDAAGIEASIRQRWAD
mgnify:CR=1 FL=1